MSGLLRDWRLYRDMASGFSGLTLRHHWNLWLSAREINRKLVGVNAAIEAARVAYFEFDVAHALAVLHDIDEFERAVLEDIAALPEVAA